MRKKKISLAFFLSSILPGNQMWCFEEKLALKCNVLRIRSLIKSLFNLIHIFIRFWIKGHLMVFLKNIYSKKKIEEKLDV